MTRGIEPLGNARDSEACGGAHTSQEDAIDLHECVVSPIARCIAQLIEPHAPSVMIDRVWSAVERAYQTATAPTCNDLTTFISALHGATHGSTATRLGDLVVLPDHALVYFLSDCEGACSELIRFLAREDIETRLRCPSVSPPVHLVFLGDSINRSSTALPFLQLLMELDSAYPGHIHVLAGNHEKSIAQQKEHEDGFFHEISRRSFLRSDDEFQLLMSSKYGECFRKYISGDDDPAWQISPKNRTTLWQKYVEAVAELHSTLSEGGECGRRSVQGELTTLLAASREKFAQYFLWDLHQLWFRCLPLAVVSSQVFGVHAMCPVSGVFNPEQLAQKTGHREELLWQLSQVSRTSDNDPDTGIVDQMLWTDIQQNDDELQDKETSPEILPNPKRGDDMVQVRTAVPELFLRSIAPSEGSPTPIMVRGHQRAGEDGYRVEGSVHTIQSSPRGGGAVLKVTLRGAEVAPKVERLTLE